ncbi:MAG: hypothetical protein AAGU73_03595 [Actinomycetota bacterium]
MQLQRELPAILETWLDFVNAHERVVAETGDAIPGPSLELLSAFAGAFVAGLSGGAADPFACGTYVALPGGARALIAVASEERGEDFGMVLDADRVTGDWVALVAFRRNRPVAVHLIESRQMGALGRALGVGKPKPPEAPPTAMVLSTAFHWNLCLERLTAEVFGVRTYYVSTGGMSCDPHPIALPPTVILPVGDVA